ncbi:hypothetical protein KJ780_03455 [Candidatus Micrarchaeota archaeon]|nr:hypothetical protein [Candidatus Micrarchaeota archaeon]
MALKKPEFKEPSTAQKDPVSYMEMLAVLDSTVKMFEACGIELSKATSSMTFRSRKADRIMEDSYKNTMHLLRVHVRLIKTTLGEIQSLQEQLKSAGTDSEREIIWKKIVEKSKKVDTYMNSIYTGIKEADSITQTLMFLLKERADIASATNKIMANFAIDTASVLAFTFTGPGGFGARALITSFFQNFAIGAMSGALKELNSQMTDDLAMAGLLPDSRSEVSTSEMIQAQVLDSMWREGLVYGLTGAALSGIGGLSRVTKGPTAWLTSKFSHLSPTTQKWLVRASRPAALGAVSGGLFAYGYVKAGEKYSRMDQIGKNLAFTLFNYDDKMVRINGSELEWAKVDLKTGYSALALLGKKFGVTFSTYDEASTYLAKNVIALYLEPLWNDPTVIREDLRDRFYRNYGIDRQDINPHIRRLYNSLEENHSGYGDITMEILFQNAQEFLELKKMKGD